MGNRKYQQDKETPYQYPKSIADGRPEAIDKVLGRLEPSELLGHTLVQIHMFSVFPTKYQQGLSLGRVERGSALSVWKGLCF